MHATSEHREKDEQMVKISPKTGSLATVVRSYKSTVTKNARQLHGDFAWQMRFHDHIIRNEKSYRTLSEYIMTNPSSWQEDKFYIS